ncbi:MAG: type II secretion system F family protein [archaeon]
MAMIFLSPTYRLLAYKTCKRLNLLRPTFLEVFKPIESSLKKARLYISLEEYFSTCFLTTMYLGLLSFPFLVLFFNMYLMFNLFLSIIFGVISSLLISALTFVLFYVYPDYVVGELRRNIERNLPYAVAHLATMAGTGVSISSGLKILGNFKEYGAVAQEARRIARNIEVFGYDPLTALSESASETPSQNFKDVLWGIVTVTRTGGDVRQYLLQKSKTLMEQQKNLEEEYVNTLSLFSEIYTTIFVAGPIMAAIMLVVMGSIGSLPLPSDLLFQIMIYVMIPLASIGFIVLIDSSKPTGLA